MIVITNGSLPSIIHKKNNHNIAYHKVRESVAAVVLCFYCVSSNMNISDLLTKPLYPINHMFFQRPLGPLSTLVSPRERVIRDVNFTTTWHVPIAHHPLVCTCCALIALHSLVQHNHSFIARRSLVRHRTH